jgi:hypothetical protein
MSSIQLVGYGVDTLILNTRYTDEKYQPVKQELAQDIAQALEGFMSIVYFSEESKTLDKS